MFRELTQLHDEREDENRRICLGVTIRSGEGWVNVFDTHFSLSPRARLLNARETARFIDEYGEEPSFLFGDLNCEPDTAPIQFLVGNLEYEGERTDFVDCWTSLRPDDPGYTYGSFDPVRRIDYALCRNAAPGLLDARVVGGEAHDGVFASDHMGILIDVNL
jgi:endonuclease/exonuclease/phosphatase family metal-dependent hydrolase